jgi:hypothetical protein
VCAVGDERHAAHPDGATIEVNGDAGTVTVLALP